MRGLIHLFLSQVLSPLVGMGGYLVGSGWNFLDAVQGAVPNKLSAKEDETWVLDKNRWRLQEWVQEENTGVALDETKKAQEIATQYGGAQLAAACAWHARIKQDCPKLGFTATLDGQPLQCCARNESESGRKGLGCTANRILLEEEKLGAWVPEKQQFLALEAPTTTEALERKVAAWTKAQKERLEKRMTCLDTFVDQHNETWIGNSIYAPLGLRAMHFVSVFGNVIVRASTRTLEVFDDFLQVGKSVIGVILGSSSLQTLKPGSLSHFTFFVGMLAAGGMLLQALSGFISVMSTVLFTAGPPAIALFGLWLTDGPGWRWSENPVVDFLKSVFRGVFWVLGTG